MEYEYMEFDNAAHYNRLLRDGHIATLGGRRISERTFELATAFNAAIREAGGTRLFPMAQCSVMLDYAMESKLDQARDKPRKFRKWARGIRPIDWDKGQDLVSARLNGVPHFPEESK